MSRSLSTQEILNRSIRAKRRFKALVRTVIANVPWLSVIEEDELTGNVRKNVQLITRRSTKEKLLTLREKGLLRKPAKYRTDEEKDYLHRIIGGLKCFRKYPEHVKMQLTAVMYFTYFPAGRIIVKQNHKARAMYFILSGKVNVSVASLDPVIKENVTTIVGSMGPGSLFGEVALLNDIPRTATITTSTPCEFLYLKKADFDIVLKATVAQEWMTIRKAMSGFSYFQDWDDLALRECCIYSKIKKFDRDQTILGDGLGVSTSCYFILKGKCRIIEHLVMETAYDKHGKKYCRLNEDIADADAHEENVFLDESKNLGSVYSLPRDVAFDSLHNKSLRFQPSKFRQKKEPLKSKKKGKQSAVLQSNETKSRPKATTSKLVFENEQAPSKRPTNPSVTRETHFMQVCILSEKACFGLGENLNRRRIIAMTDKVECLLIPRYWLLQRNKGNIWSRITQYLNNQIPSTRQVFEQFLAQRKWLSYRKKLFADICRKAPINSYYNIPYSIRVSEDVSFNEQIYNKI